MKILLIWCLFTILNVGVFAQTKPSEDDALLKPPQQGYDEAVKFANVLDQAGIHVQKILNSKLNGFFRGVDRAAYYRTDKGVIEAIFFPDDEAEKIQVIETRDGSRYVYSFTGQPNPNPPSDTFDSSKPMYFLARDNAFIIIWGDKNLFETLKGVKERQRAMYEPKRKQ